MRSLQFGIQWQLDDRAVFVGRAVGGFHHFDATKSFLPRQTRLGTVGDPADEVAELLAVSVIEPEIVEPFEVRLQVIVVLPVQIKVLQERNETYAALPANGQRTARFAKPQRRIGRRHVQRRDCPRGELQRNVQRVGEIVAGINPRSGHPSSLLMAAIPARVAGVPQIVVATPPRDGELNDTILAAAYLGGVREVYAIGGAQAIAALAYGTESVPRVDKILGPGSIFVVLAKRRVYGTVGIDQLPGPTETLLVADETANPGYVAADMLAQAEHDPLASALLLTPSAELAHQVGREIARQLETLSRKEIILSSLATRGGIVVTQDIDEAIALANEYAPEHLCLLTANPWELVGRVENAGGIFIGELSSEALGDYVIGPSHIMPTGQTARFSSPVNVWDFVKITSVFGVSPSVAKQISPAAITIAQEEGLTAHARAIRMRHKELEEADKV